MFLFKPRNRAVNRLVGFGYFDEHKGALWCLLQSHFAIIVHSHC